MKKLVSLSLVLLIVVLSASPVFAEELIRTTRPEIENSRYALLYEESTDTILYDKDAYKGNAPASMTKVMAAVIVLEHNPELKGTATVSAKAISTQYCYWLDDWHLLEGEEVSVEDLMNYFLIVSGNEAGTTLAEYTCGDIDVFIAEMNAKALELGMNDSRYYDPHGLSDYNRVTCEDMLKLCRYAMTFDKFREIVCKTQGTLPASNKHSSPYHYTTTNRVMNPRGTSEYKTGFEQDIIGIKTGFTNAAGNNLSCCMVHDDLTFYSVVMHAHDEKNANGSWIEMHYADTAELMKWARSFKKVGMAAGTEGRLLKGTKFSMFKNVYVKTAEDVYILAQDEVEPTYEYFMGTKVKAGDIVGKMTYTDEFGNSRSTDLIATADAGTVWRYYIGGLLLAAAFGFSAGAIGKKNRKDPRKPTDKKDIRHL